jgi:hypothetical protein
MRGVALLIDILRNPVRLQALDHRQWDVLLRQAREEKLLAHLGRLIDEQAIQGTCPARAIDIIANDHAYLEHQRTLVRLEVRELHQALGAHGIPMVLLKGAAYLGAGMALARYRHLSDVDILLPEGRLEEAERVLSEAGWTTKGLDEYDDHYYRAWMHELPPMTHRHRAMEVDIHHRLLPKTSRLQPDPRPLLQDSLAVTDDNCLRLPCPADMLLHSACHLYYDSDFHHKLRDLLDLHQLSSEFAGQPEFWNDLLPRAERLQLTLPLYYALTGCRTTLGTDIPDAVVERLASAVRPGPVNGLTAWLARRVLTPVHPDRRQPVLAPWLLYLRSHWLRMPPGLLTRHLLRKSLRRMGIGD